MKTLDEILWNGIKESDWTYCKAEYAPHSGCKIGMPEEYTPDGTTKPNVKTLYIVTAKFRDGETMTCTEFMYLSDGRFYWYDNLWNDDEIVDQEKEDKKFMEPIAWIAYKNIPDSNYAYPIAPHKSDVVPIPIE